MHNDALLVLVVVVALAFDFTNGFHDTANAIATSVATRALRPRVAVVLSAVLNMVGAFLSLKVATTIAKGIIDSNLISLNVVFAALLGAILWNVATWYLGIPSSSSHALIGGLVGAMWVASGSNAVQWDGIVRKVIVPAAISPVMAAVVAALGTYLGYRLVRRIGEDAVDSGYRHGQIASASLVSLAHGTNDAQKTMGVITLALVANGNLNGQHLDTPTWVIVAAALSMGLGTYVGGWRVVRTLGRRITDIHPPQGLAAEVSGASIILASSFYGYPLSTTHVISGGVMGAGLGRRGAAVKWSLAGRILFAWLVTLPCAAAIAAGAKALSGVAGSDTSGAVVTGVLVAAICAGLFVLSRREPIHADNVNVPSDERDRGFRPAPARVPMTPGRGPATVVAGSGSRARATPV